MTFGRSSAWAARRGSGRIALAGVVLATLASTASSSHQEDAAIDSTVEIIDNDRDAASEAASSTQSVSESPNAATDLPSETFDTRPTPDAGSTRSPPLPAVSPGAVDAPPRASRSPTPKPWVAIPHAANEVVIRLLVEPPGIAHVFWGVKDFGAAPLQIIRPRGSGPLDLILRAPKYVSFHTRAYTDRDEQIAIQMVRATADPRAFGYPACDTCSAIPEAAKPSGVVRQR